MRSAYQIQPCLRLAWLDAEPARELAMISGLLDASPGIEALVLKDLEALSRRRGSAAGRSERLTAEQVLRALLVKQRNGFTFRALAFHLADSQTYRTFCRLGLSDPNPSKSALAAAIKSLRSETLEAIHHVILAVAREAGVETGRKARIDCTVVESNIHRPMDSTLLGDGIRLVTRALVRSREQGVVTREGFANRTRRARRRCREILHAKNPQQRNESYRDLLGVAQEVLAWGLALEKLLRRRRSSSPALERIARPLKKALPLLRQVIDQARRRIVDGQSVPAAEKVTSFFEAHTDILRKDNRDTYYGHKVCLVTGASSLILDAVVLKGNPADVTLPETMIDRQVALYGRPPRQAAFDGGFTSGANLATLKAKGVEDVAFSKRRNLAVAGMVKSPWVYQRLRRFRAGIEANISLLKRAFGFDRCTWRSRASFESYVWSSILACNLVVLARHLLAR